MYLEGDPDLLNDANGTDLTFSLTFVVESTRRRRLAGKSADCAKLTEGEIYLLDKVLNCSD